MNRSNILWLALMFTSLSLIGCASSGPPQAPIVAEVRSQPEGIEVTFRGRAVGTSPIELNLRALEESVEISTVQVTPPVVERRIRVLDDQRIQVLFKLGDQPTKIAKKLGLSSVIVFDYGERTTFDSDKYDLKPSFLPMLERQAQILRDHFGDLDVYVCGHTDSTGARDHNQLLSLNRAEAVAKTLISHGVDRKRVQSMGFGFDFPLASNDTTDGRTLNRRTEIILPDGF